jgi:hypothetical protein
MAFVVNQDVLTADGIGLSIRQKPSISRNCWILIGLEMDFECACSRRWRLEHYIGQDGSLLGPSWILPRRSPARPRRATVESSEGVADKTASGRACGIRLPPAPYDSPVLGFLASPSVPNKGAEKNPS